MQDTGNVYAGLVEKRERGIERSALVRDCKISRDWGPAMLKPAIASVRLFQVVPAGSGTAAKNRFVIALSHAGAEHHVVTLAEAGHGEVTGDTATLADEWSKAGATGNRWDRVRQKSIEPRMGAGPVMR